jgi:hypothetical protein
LKIDNLKNGDAVTRLLKPSAEREHFAVKLQHQGRRDNFNLGTPNRTAAAVKARDIYVYLQANGGTAAG